MGDGVGSAISELSKHNHFGISNSPETIRPPTLGYEAGTEAAAASDSANKRESALHRTRGRGRRRSTTWQI